MQDWDQVEELAKQDGRSDREHRVTGHYHADESGGKTGLWHTKY